jgi:ubiquinone/menaquinone biosynthesis C-methylase UbiE
MKDRTYEDEEYWNNLRRSRDRPSHEHVFTDGNDGENEFDTKILNTVVGQAVLDVGCGIGEFTLRIAERAREVVGVDFSKEAIRRATTKLKRTGIRNCKFKQADANELPFPDAAFDVVVSRRGPVTASMQSLSEAYRVMKEGGTLMEITIGEKDKRNIVKIFGRGQMHGVTERVVVAKSGMLKSAGFLILDVKDYLATEVFQAMNDLIVRLNSAPIIPNFDVKRDEKYLERVKLECTTSRGIETEVHRVTILATKPLPRGT